MKFCVMNNITRSEKVVSASENGYIVRVEGLEKTFSMGKGTLRVLKDVNLKVRAGEMLGIVGSSGAGKSTLLHLLGALDRPTSGKIYYSDVELSELKEDELARFRNVRIGFVFQFHHLLPEFTALENVMMPALIQRLTDQQALERGEEILKEVGLQERLHHRPGELSGGEQQRVALARALINQPEVILADEPTGNLDSQTSQDIHKVLKRLNQFRKQTFIIVTHNERLTANLDRVIRLEDGRICEGGNYV